MMREPAFNEDFVYAAALERCAVAPNVYDDIEPLSADADFKAGYRAASARGLYLINAVLAWIVGAKNPRVGAAQCGFALGSAVFNGEPMQAVGARLGVSRAAISKGARSFAASTGITPVGSLKADTKSYRSARLASVKANNTRLERAVKKEKTS